MNKRNKQTAANRKSKKEKKIKTKAMNSAKIPDKASKVNGTKILGSRKQTEP